MRSLAPFRRLTHRAWDYLLGNAPPARKKPRSRLGVEALEGRDVPAVVFESTYAWDGVGTVTVTVDDAVPGYEGLYHWDYRVQNDSFGDGIGFFAVQVGDAFDVEDFGSSVNWDYSNNTVTDVVQWDSGESGTPIPTGGAANFWVTTQPTGVMQSTGIIADPAFNAQVTGPVAAPAPAAPPPPAVTVERVSDTTENWALGVFRFTRTGDTDSALVVDYSVGGTAAEGGDYAGLPRTVTFEAGSRVAEVEVEIIRDNIAEPDETVEVTVLPGAGYLPGSQDPAVMAVRDDPDAVFALIHQESFQLTVDEGSGDEKTLDVTLTVVKNADGPTGLYTWTYDVSNPTSDPAESEGWTEFTVSMPGADWPDVRELGSSIDWAGAASADSLTWSGAMPLGPGQSATFSFKTAERWVVPGAALASSGASTATLSTAPTPSRAAGLEVTTLGTVPNIPAGGVTLRAAIEYANTLPGRVSVITLPLLFGTTNLDRELPAIRTDVFLNGPGAGNFTLTRAAGAPDFPLLAVGAGGSAVVSGVTLRGGRGEFGGGIVSMGTSLVVTGSVIRDNSTTSDGGGIWARRGVLEVYDSEINGNSSTGGLGGGGIFASPAVSRVRIGNSVVGLNYTQAANGGGVYVFGVRDTVIDNTVVTGNSAANAGGGIYVDGGFRGALTLSGTTNINNNIVRSIVPNTSTGGGVYFTGGTINLLGITIGSNEARTGDGMYLNNRGVVRNPGAGGVTYTGGDAEASGPL